MDTDRRCGSAASWWRNVTSESGPSIRVLAGDIPTRSASTTLWTRSLVVVFKRKLGSHEARCCDEPLPYWKSYVTVLNGCPQTISRTALAWRRARSDQIAIVSP